MEWFLSFIISLSLFLSLYLTLSLSLHNISCTFDKFYAVKQMFVKTSITPLINKKQIYKCQTFRSTDLHQLSTKENIQTKYNVTPS